MAVPGAREPPSEVLAALGDPDAYPMLRDLVAIAPTNLEDPAHGRWEKPNYPAAARYVSDVARRYGLAVRQFDPVTDLRGGPDLHGVPRPNVIVDLDAGAADRVLVLVHYDVVPVPEAERARWGTPPHALTYREDGNLYGRGSADDLGSGVVPGLLLLKQLRALAHPPVNVRLLVCCDEETGGTGGIEALKAHDAQLPPRDPGRFLEGECALIADGDSHTTAGSSGVAFLDGTFARPVPLPRVVAYGEALVALHSTASRWRSTLASPDWPAHGAPEPVITGRATVTRFEARSERPGPGGRARLVAAHAESDAANQVARSVTLVFEGARRQLEELRPALERRLAAPFRLEPAGATALSVPAGALALSVVGESTHAGYPHRGHNPVPATLDLLAGALAEGRLDESGPVEGSFSVDLRLTPEMTLAEGVERALREVRAWGSAHDPDARIDAPAERGRGGYALPADHPAVRKMERVIRSVFGTEGVFGEYGGTDASALADLTTPSGAKMPALVFGLMNRASHIHEVDERVEPRTVAQVTDVLRRYILQP